MLIFRLKLPTCALQFKSFMEKCIFLRILFFVLRKQTQVSLSLGEKKKKGNKIELMFQARRSPSCCRVEVVRHSLELRYTGIYQSEGDRSFSRQRDKKTKKKPFQFFFSPSKGICRNFLLWFFLSNSPFFFLSNSPFFATVEMRTKWKYIKLARIQFF